MIAISVGLLGGLETAAASVGKKGEDGPAFADTLEQAAASGRTKVAAKGTQVAVKIERGTAQTKKTTRATQGDGGTKQAGLVAVKDGAVVQGGKGRVAGKKIADVADVVEEQAAGGFGDGEGLQAGVARAVVPGVLAEAGRGRIVTATKDGAGSAPEVADVAVEVAGVAVEVAGLAVEVAGLSKEVRVPSTGALQGGVQGPVGASREGAGRASVSSAVAQKQGTVGSGDGAEGAIGGSIRPDARGAIDGAAAVVPVVANANASVALAGGVVPDAAVEGAAIGKGLTKGGEEGGLWASGGKALPVKSDVGDFVPVRTLRTEGSAVAVNSLHVEGVTLPKNLSQTRLAGGDAVAGSFSEPGQIASGARTLGDAGTVATRRVTVAKSDFDTSPDRTALGQSEVGDALAARSVALPWSGAAKSRSAIPMADGHGSAEVETSAGAKVSPGSLVAPRAATAIQAGVEGTAAEADGGLEAGAARAQGLSVAAAKGDAPVFVAQPAIVAHAQTTEGANAAPQVAEGDERAVEVLQGAVREVAPHSSLAGRVGPRPDLSRTTAQRVVRHGETEPAKETSAPEIGSGRMMAEVSAAGVDASAGLGAGVVAATFAGAAPHVIASDVTGNEVGPGVAPVGGPDVATAAGLRGSDPGAGAQATQSMTAVGAVTGTIAHRVEGSKVVQSSSGQAPVVQAEQALPHVDSREAGQGIEAPNAADVPVEANAAAGAVAVGRVEAAAVGIAPVKAGQDRKVAGGPGQGAVRERKGVAVDDKASDVSASPGMVETGRTVALASGADLGAASPKPVSAEHRVQWSDGGQMSAAPVASVDGAAVQAHGPSIVPVNAAPAASGAGSATASVAPHAASSAGSAESLVSPMAHTTLQATPTVLEVGVPGGTHGWLKIRAEIGEGGAVTASMSASSHAGQDALRRDLPAMSAFLESEHVPVSLQVVHGTGSSWADKDGAMTQGGSSLGGGMDPGLRQSAGQDGQGSGREAGGGMLADAGSDGGRQQGAGSSSQSGMVAGPVGRGGAVAQGVSEGEAAWTAAPGYGSGVRGNGGSWLNVMA